MDEDAKRKRLVELEQELERLRGELGLPPSGRVSEGLSKREALLVEAERVAHLGSWTWNLQTGEIAWSDEFFRIVGYDPARDTPSYEAFFAAIHPEDQERVREASNRSLENESTEAIEFRIKRPDGELRWVRMEAAFVHEPGRPKTHVVGTVLDETDKLRAAAALARAVDELNEAQRIADLGSWRWDLSDGRVDWSAGMYRLLGLSGDEVPSEELFYKHVHAEDAQRVKNVAADAIASGVTKALELRIVRRDGQVRDALLRSRALFDERRNVVGFQGVMQDITERKALELQVRQSQKMEALGTLAGGVAHDFNNYLLVLGGHVELLSANLVNDQRSRRSLDAISYAYQRCAALTHQLLTLSRKRPAQLRQLDLVRLLEELLPMLRSILGPGIALSLECERSSAPIVADPAQVEQALMNLIVNARDAMEKGGVVTLHVADVCTDPDLAPSTDSGHHVRLSVKDNGCGIPQGLLARIFEPFFTTKGVGKGTGLGLFAVYSILRDAGGKVDVESELGLGTTFHLYFRAAEGVDQRPAIGEGGEVVSAGNRTILLVEDVDLVRELLERQLRSVGYGVVTADNGASALEVLDREQVHAVVSDAVMPRMGGVELLREVRRRYPELPCLLITGYSAETLFQDAHGQDVPLLRKPFTTREFLATLARLLPVERVASTTNRSA